jgi:VIT1/CCC1 family predicted Fe2+/Mn2+ transporter
MPRHDESHRVDAIGGLRAAVLGANDGIVSTASLIVGVAAGGATAHTVALTGVAGLVAGALSMAAGEYVSVSSQADSENADRAREEMELVSVPEAEREELTLIYEGRGLDRALAEQVAAQLMAKDALGAHLRDELGLSEVLSARPVQAALFSAASFAVGAALPLLVALLVPQRGMIVAVSIAGLVLLAVLGAVGARAGGAPVLRAVLRVTFWGALAFAVTALIGRLFGAAV